MKKNIWKIVTLATAFTICVMMGSNGNVKAESLNLDQVEENLQTLELNKDTSVVNLFNGSVNKKNCYEFTLSNPGKITCSFGFDTQTLVYVYEVQADGTRKIIGTYNPSVYRDSLTLRLGSGKYCIMTPYNVAGNLRVDYEAELADYNEQEKNNDISSANSIEFNKTIRGIINDAGSYSADANYKADVDYYKVVQTEYGVLSVSLNGSGNEKASLLNESGKELASVSNKGSLASSKEVTLQPGIYYVAVSGDVNKEYDVTVNRKTMSEAAASSPSITGKRASVNSVKISWKKDSNAAGYYLYQRQANGTYKRIASLKNTTTSYTAKKLALGKNHVYMLRSYIKIDGKIFVQKDSNVLTMKLSNKLPKPTYKLKRTRFNGTRAISLDITKRTYLDQVTVYYKVGKSGKWKKLNTCGKKENGLYHFKLTKGKTYYYRLKGKAKVNGKTYYSEYSKVQSLKCK